MAANSLRPQIVRALAAHRERPLTTTEIYQHVAASGVAGFDPKAKRDRNLVNRELSDLAGMSPESHGKPTPQLLARVGRGRYIFREPELPMDPRPGAGVPGADRGVREAAAAGETFRAGAGKGAGADGPLRGAAGRLPGLRNIPAPLPAI